MKSGRKEFLEGGYYALLARNKSNEYRLSNIKKKAKITFATLASGLGYSSAEEFCVIADYSFSGSSTYYDYLILIEPIIEQIAIDICQKKLELAFNEEQLVVGFDAGWAHKRNANHCIATLIDLLTGFIVSFHIVHHGAQNDEITTSTNSHAKAMEKIALTHILDKVNIDNMEKTIIVHDCDIMADNLIQLKWPNAIQKYDPNHYCTKQKRLIDAYCCDESLKSISERLKKFYSELLHERTLSLEEKVTKWKNALNHYIETEKWTKENNENSISSLKKIIDIFSGTFEKVDAHFSTNPCESFNFSRALLASKNTGWKRSWRLRAFISIIRWNCKDWIKLIMSKLMIDKSKQAYIEKSRCRREINKPVTKTEEKRKERSVYRKNASQKYVAKKNEKNLHEYKKNTKPNVNKIKKLPNFVDLSHYQVLILEAISSNSTEDKKYVSSKKIINHVLKYQDSSCNPALAIKATNAQLTRLTNSQIILKKKRSYSLNN